MGKTIKNKNFFFLFTVIFITASGFLFPQDISNLQALNNIVDSSISIIVKENNLIGKSISVENKLVPVFSVFNNQIISSLNKYGVRLSDSVKSLKMSYSIEEAGVNYENLSRDGLFGKYYIERNFRLKGNYIIASKETALKNFSFSFRDTVQFDDLKKRENPSIPFTQGEIPAEPVWSSLLEPAVAVGGAAVIIYLFFAVRSK
jgi:hypothetical protein